MQTIEAQVTSSEQIATCASCVHYQKKYCWYPQRGDDWMPVEPSYPACNVYRDRAECVSESDLDNEEF